MVQRILTLFGIVFVFIGILGLFQPMLFGLFWVQGAHSILHLLSGLIAIICARRSRRAAQNFALVFAVIYGVASLVGFVQGGDSVFGLFVVNPADNYLHAFLVPVFLYIGFLKNDHGEVVVDNRGV